MTLPARSCDKIDQMFDWSHRIVYDHTLGTKLDDQLCPEAEKKSKRLYNWIQYSKEDPGQPEIYCKLIEN